MVALGGERRPGGRSLQRTRKLSREYLLGLTTLPLGQGLSASPGNANAVKALADTNMQMAGALPAPQGFWIQSIEVDVQPGSSTTANTYAIQTVASSAAAPAGSPATPVQ